MATSVMAPVRPRACRSYDDDASADSRVMVCGGFSKTVATGLRIGWCVPGTWMREVARMKAWTFTIGRFKAASPSAPASSSPPRENIETV